MNTFLRLIICCCFTIIAHQSLSAQWMDGGRKQSQPIKGNSALFVHEGTIYFYNEDLGMQKSTDNAKTWIDLPDSGLPEPGAGVAKSIKRFSAGNGRIYAGMNFGTGSGMPFYSTDKGVSWIMDTLGAPGHALGWTGLPVVSDIYSWGKWLYVKWDSPNQYHFKTFDTPYKQNNYMATGSNQPRSVLAKGDTLFASSTKLYYTIDGGENWIVPQNNGYPTNGGGGLLVADGHRLYLFAFKAFAQPCYMFYTDDNGNNWTEVDITAVTKQKILNGDYYYPTAAFVRAKRIELAFQQSKFTTPPNVWKSTDLGVEWSRDTLGLPTSFIHNISTFDYTPDGMLWCVPSLENIYKQKLDNGVVNSSPTEEEDAFVLSPNPCHDYLTINFPNAGLRSLELRDYLGRIIQEQTISANTFVINIDIEQLHLGCYFITLKDNAGARYTKTLVKD